jgi:hypothetical protein
MTDYHYRTEKRAKRSGSGDERLPELQALVIIGGLSVLSWAAIIAVAWELWAVL